jgi:hypothetical protein
MKPLKHDETGASKGATTGTVARVNFSQISDIAAAMSYAVFSLESA